MLIPPRYWFAAMLLLPSPGFAFFGQSYSDCSGTQVGVLSESPKVKALYSECTSNNGSTSAEYHWSLTFDDARSPLASVRIQAWVPDKLNPSPMGAFAVGTVGLSDFGLQNMGSDYIGDCTDASATTDSLSLTIGDVYCGWARTASGGKILLKAEDNKGEIVDFSVRQNAREPDKIAAPVPSLGVFYLLALIAGLVGLASHSQFWRS
jgi:hypothetical protein